MSSKLFPDFDERVQEVNRYFKFIQNLDKGTTRLCIDDNGTNKINKIDLELEKTLKATGFLLLYNLIESTMRNAIQTIIDTITSRNLSFDELSDKIKKIILDNFKGKNLSNELSSVNSIAFDLVSTSLQIFNIKRSFSGNIDSDSIKKIADRYGFSSVTNNKKTRGGADLATVKEHRNDLAHGDKSFNEVGRDISADKLVRVKDRVVIYLEQILQNVEKYLDNQEYLKS